MRRLLALCFLSGAALGPAGCSNNSLGDVEEQADNRLGNLEAQLSDVQNELAEANRRISDMDDRTVLLEGEIRELEISQTQHDLLSH